MSFTFNGAKAQVDITGGVTTTNPSLATTQTTIQKCRNENAPTANTDITLYIVTAGKKLYVSSVTYYQASSPTSWRFGDGSAAAIASDTTVSSRVCTGFVGTESTKTITFPIPMVFETSFVWQTSSNGGDAIMSFTGWEQ